MAPKLTPTQRRVLLALAAGGRLASNPLIQSGFHCLPVNGGIFTVRYSAWLKLERARYIEQIPQTWPHEYRITAAGRDRAAQEAPSNATT